MTDFYAALGIPPSASMDEIRSAYKRSVRDAHPDLQGNAETFRAVQEAYAVLSDSQKRAAYDHDRREWMRRIGAVGCARCGAANRIARRPGPDERVCCARCRAALPVTFGDVLAAQRQSLVSETARFVDEVGIELSELASDAVRAGIGRLRKRLGFLRGEELLPAEPDSQRRGERTPK